MTVAPPKLPTTTLWTLQPEDQFELVRGAKRRISSNFLPADRQYIDVDTPDPSSNLVAVGVGEKISGGKPTGLLCVRLYVRKKYDRRQIRSEHLLHAIIQHDDVLLDVIETGLLEHQLELPEPDPTFSIDPLQPGCSVSPCDCDGTGVPTGTLGPVLGNGYHAITCAHVLSPRCPHKHDYVYNPGQADAGGTGRVVANTSSLYEALPGRENELDVAIIDLREPPDPRVMFIGPVDGPIDPDYDMVVHKFARSSRYSVGRITDLDFEPILVDRSWSPPRSVKYVRHLAVTPLTAQPFSAGGDSGALVLRNPGNAPVGLIVGGSRSVTAVTPISSILDLAGEPVATGNNYR